MFLQHYDNITQKKDIINQISLVQCISELRIYIENL